MPGEPTGQGDGTGPVPQGHETSPAAAITSPPLPLRDPNAPIEGLAEAAAALTAPGQPFEMETADVRGLSMRVWKTAPPTLRDVLELSKVHGDASFVVYEDERFTFTEHYRQVVALAHRLIDHCGVRKGDRLVIAMRNLPEWVVTFWAAVAAGAVVVPLNAWWLGEELEYGLTDSGAVVAVTDTERAQRLAPFLERVPSLRHLVVVDEHRGQSSPGNATLPAGTMAFAELLGDVPDEMDLPDVPLAPDDDATIFYTSGTTGHPKGAVGTHRNACTNLMNLFFINSASARRFGTSVTGSGSAGQTTHLLSVPLFHVTGCMAVMCTAAAAGAKMVMLHHFNPERALELIEREQVTGFGGVPAMVMQILDSPDFARRDLSSVRSVSYGGAPAPPELVRRIMAHFPASQPGNGYGLTETSAMIAMNTGPDYVTHPDSVGHPVPVCDIAIVPEDYAGAEPELGATEPEPGETGELWVKGPSVVRGYWQREEDTRRVITNGWLRTGDLARRNEDGFLFIVDRAKDVIIRGGENIYSVEVEDALFDHPAVADCAVIGCPDRVLGEVVGAVVVLRPGATVGAEELSRFVADRMARFNVPTQWWFRTEPIPRNPAGKVLKRDLRRELLGD